MYFIVLTECGKILKLKLQEGKGQNNKQEGIMEYHLAGAFVTLTARLFGVYSIFS